MRQDLVQLQDHLLSAIGEAVIATDLDACATYWNPAAQRLLGWAPEEVVGRRLRELIVPAQALPDVVAVREAVLEGLCWSGAMRLIHRGGHVLLVELTVTPTRDTSGAVTGTIAVLSDRTEREQVSANLRWIAAVVDAVSDAVVVVTLPSGTVSHVNAATRRLLHREQAELLKQDVRTLAEESGSSADELLASLNRGQGWRGRLTIGSEQLLTHLDVSAEPVRDLEGRLVSGAIVARDVTAQVEAEDALRRSEARFRALVQRSGDAALICDPDGILLYASPALTELFGYTPADIEGRSGFEFIHPDDVATAEGVLAAALDAPGPQPPVELRVRTADGRWIWTEESVSNQLADPDINGIVLNLRDITVRKQADLALAESEQRFRAIVEAAEEGIWILGPDDRTTFVNNRLERLLDVPAGSVLGRSPLEYVHEDDHDLLADALSRQPTGDRGRLECRFRTASGGIVHVLISGHPLFDADGRYRGTQGMFTDITELKSVQERLLKLSVRDEVTGLANRTFLTEHLATLLEAQHRHEELAAVLFVELDGDYTDLAETYGHEFGDQLLVEAAERIGSAARPGDLVGRFSDSAFAVVCTDLDDAGESQRIAQRIGASVSEPMLLNGITCFTAPTIGIAHTPASSADVLLRDAATAAHRAGENGVCRTAVFSPDVDERRRADRALVDELRLALAGGAQLTLHYQPVVALPSQRPIGVEALVRWHHPTRGLLGPDMFVLLAEQARLTPLLDRWVLREAAAALTRWRRSDLVDDDFYMAVNISGGHYADAALVTAVQDALSSSGLPAANLVLEVTETAVVTDTEAATGVLSRLKKLGVGLSIDDFGTGYSSLSYLRRFPVDTLKVDRSFVSGIGGANDDTAIVASTLSLAEAVGMRCVAEGVETAEQLQALIGLGCRYAQGYLWARPVPEGDLAAALSLTPAVVVPPQRRERRHEVLPLPTRDPEIQRQILRMHREGASLQTIAAALNRDGYRTAKRTRWHSTTVARMVADLTTRFASRA